MHPQQTFHFECGRASVGRIESFNRLALKYSHKFVPPLRPYKFFHDKLHWKSCELLHLTRKFIVAAMFLHEYHLRLPHPTIPRYDEATENKEKQRKTKLRKTH